MSSKIKAILTQIKCPLKFKLKSTENVSYSIELKSASGKSMSPRIFFTLENQDYQNREALFIEKEFEINRKNAEKVRIFFLLV